MMTAGSDFSDGRAPLDESTSEFSPRLLLMKLAQTFRSPRP